MARTARVRACALGPSARAPRHACGRRVGLAGAAAGLLPSTLGSGASATPLGPLGPVGAPTGGPKRVGQTPEDVASQLEVDLRDMQYFVTGDLTPELFRDDCRFRDPTNDVVGLSRYRTALKALFDPADSRVTFRGIKVTGPNTVEADWTLQGTLKLPWRPVVPEYVGHTVYSLDKDGLIELQDQTWSISAAKALAETFTPGALSGQR